MIKTVKNFVHGQNNSYNTVIYGIGATVSTKAALALKLGVSEGLIKSFELDGLNIKCKITSDFTLSTDCFYNNSDFKKYFDFDGRVTAINPNGIRNSGVEELYLPAVTYLQAYGIAYNPNLLYLNLPEFITPASQCVRNNTGLLEFHAPKLTAIGNITSGGQQNFFDSYNSCNIISMRKLKIYGSPSSGTTGNTSGFLGLKMGCVIEVHIDLATANAGTANTSLIWAKTNRGAIVKFYDDNGNYVSTL